MLKNILPSIVTRAALSYPIAYINSISFLAKNKLIAACFWNNATHENSLNFYGTDIPSVHYPGCYIYNPEESIELAEVEISGTDDKGGAFIVMLPIPEFIYRQAS
jgi:hypothetical protein